MLKCVGVPRSERVSASGVTAGAVSDSLLSNVVSERSISEQYDEKSDTWVSVVREADSIARLVD